MKIKSALELALERTEGVQADKSKIEEKNYIEKGKKIAASYLSASDINNADIKKSVHDGNKQQQSWLQKGFFDTLMSNLVLPKGEEDTEKTTKILDGVKAALGHDQSVDYAKEQLIQFFKQLLDDKENLKNALAQQLAPKLRQKEEQLRKQTGQEIKLSPEQDPEYMKALQQNMTHLEQQYSQAMNQLKSQLREMFGL